MREEKTERTEDEGRGPVLTRRQALIGAGIAATAIAAGPVSLALPEVALAQIAGITIASKGLLHYPYADWSDHTASHASWFQSSRGTAMYCINRSNHNFAANWASGSSRSFWDSSAFGLFSRDSRIARAVAYLVANHRGAAAASYEATECQIAVWMVLEYATVDVSWDTAFVRVWGNSNTHMQPVSVQWASDAWAYGKAGNTSHDRHVYAWLPADGTQPLAFWNPIVTTDLWFGVTAAAKNGHVLPDGVYRLRNGRNTSFYLDAHNSSNMGDQLCVWSSDGSRAQQFHLKCVSGTNLYEIRPLTNLALTFDVANAGGSGAGVMKWYQNSTASNNQRFYIEASTGGTWCLIPAHDTSLALTASSLSQGSGVTVTTRTRESSGQGTTSPNQRWVLERIDTSTGSVTQAVTDSYSKKFSGGVYAIYDHENLDVELGRFSLRDDGWGHYEGVWDEVEENYYVHMVSCPAGYKADKMTYRFNVQESLVSNGGRPWMATSLEPITHIVRFYVVDLDGTTHLVSSATLATGTWLTTAAACFAAAEAAAKKAYPDDYPYLRKWYRDVATSTAFASMTLSADLTLFARRPGAVHFMYQGASGAWQEAHSSRMAYKSTLKATDQLVKDADSRLQAILDVETLDYVPRWYTGKDLSTRLSSVTVTGDVWLYAKVGYGYVTHYVDGTDSAHVVTMPDGAKAKFGPFAYGYRYTVDASVTEAARAAGCTPGLACWYSDPADPWVTSDPEPATPATAGSFTQSLVVRAAETGLYATNRLTLSYALADGSVNPADEDLTSSMADGAQAADTTLPAAEVLRRARTHSMRGYELAYKRADDSRWRTLRPRAWYGDAAATGTPSLSVKPSADCTRYALWQWNTADGVVDERG